MPQTRLFERQYIHFYGSFRSFCKKKQHFSLPPLSPSLVLPFPPLFPPIPDSRIAQLLVPWVQKIGVDCVIRLRLLWLLEHSVVLNVSLTHSLSSCVNINKAKDDIPKVHIWFQRSNVEHFWWRFESVLQESWWLPNGTSYLISQLYKSNSDQVVRKKAKAVHCCVTFWSSCHFPYVIIWVSQCRPLKAVDI